MSVAVHDPVEYVDRDEAEQARHPRAVVWSAAAATLAVITGPLIAAALGFVDRVDPADEVLTSTAQRVLEELPGAFETGGLVVVPAGSDPSVAWTGIVTPDRVAGASVDLGVNGLAEYGYLPSSGTAPAWLSRVAPTDRVYSDVGNLSFACMRWPGAAERCTGTLLMTYGAVQHVFRSGLSVGESAEQIRTFRVLDAGLPTQLVLGAMPRGAVAAMVLTADDREVRARTSDPGVVGGETLWWLSVTEPVRTITFFDAKYRVLEQVNVVD